ncbi:MAG TPA: hypothetical protein VFB28_03850 [Terriglobales bacterium]|nr:hypothetical protein [Terriglobales bacterium]
MKKFEITYSLKFVNVMLVSADSAEDAVKRMRQIEDEEGELAALKGWEEPEGYQIERVEEVQPDPA